MSAQSIMPFALSLSKGSPERSEGSALRSAQQKASNSLSPNGEK